MCSRWLNGFFSCAFPAALADFPRWGSLWGPDFRSLADSIRLSATDTVGGVYGIYGGRSKQYLRLLPSASRLSGPGQLGDPEELLAVMWFAGCRLNIEGLRRKRALLPSTAGREGWRRVS